MLQLRGQRLNPLRSFYMMTLGNARAMSLDQRIGSVAVGMDADLVVLDARATPANGPPHGRRRLAGERTVPAANLRRRPRRGRDLCGGQGHEVGIGGGRDGHNTGACRSLPDGGLPGPVLPLVRFSGYLRANTSTGRHVRSARPPEIRRSRFCRAMPSTSPRAASAPKRSMPPTTSSPTCRACWPTPRRCSSRTNMTTTANGMDGWESRRKRTAGHDYAIVRLAAAGRHPRLRCRHVAFHRQLSPGLPHRGLHRSRATPARASGLDRDPAADAARRLGASLSALAIGKRVESRSTPHLSRLAAWRGCASMASRISTTSPLPARPSTSPPASMAAASSPIRMPITAPSTACSHPGRGTDMGDGWETRRRRIPGNDWIIVALGARGILEAVEIDTAHYQGQLSRQLLDPRLRPRPRPRRSRPGGSSPPRCSGPELLGPQKLNPDAIHTFGNGQRPRPGDPCPPQHLPRWRHFPPAPVREAGRVTRGTAHRGSDRRRLRPVRPGDPGRRGRTTMRSMPGNCERYHDLAKIELGWRPCPAADLADAFEGFCPAAAPDPGRAPSARAARLFTRWARTRSSSSSPRTSTAHPGTPRAFLTAPGQGGEHRHEHLARCADAARPRSRLPLRRSGRRGATISKSMSSPRPGWCGAA